MANDAAAAALLHITVARRRGPCRTRFCLRRARAHASELADNQHVADPYDLQRFVEAQRPVYARALAEVRTGRKRSHWMWFVFPQLAGLGSSPTAQRYAIASAAEAAAYLAHPLLGPRLRECAEALLAVPRATAHDIFGTPDDMKLRSSATLFAAVSPPGSVFHGLLARYFPEGPDPRTLQLLQG
jgi:uncharacterized protein (DUF1810 family)